MNFVERFDNIKAFLKAHEFLYDKEFLKQYPNPYPDLILPWIEELNTWDLEELAELESHPHEDLVKNENFKKYLKEIRLLSDITDQVHEEKTLSDNLLRKLNPKKKHELSILKTITDKIDVSTLIDVGGGIGHLSSVLVHGNKAHSISVDYDKNLQEIGRGKIKRWLENSENRISFEKHLFTSETKLNGKFDPDSTLTIGLHSCGRLSTDIIKFSSHNKIKNLINFGCCYHKLDNHYNISNHSRHNPIEFSTNALHLASRCGAIITSNDLELRWNFKKYRYALHYYLFDKLNIPFSGLGNAGKADYVGSFSLYAKKCAPEGCLDSLDDKILENYFSDELTQSKIKNNIIADSIRLLLGRVIEIYIALDRVIYLGESHYEVALSQVFDRSLSPRNIMINANRIR